MIIDPDPMLLNNKSRISPGLILLHVDVLFIAPSELGFGLFKSPDRNQ
jgi:hypothetical protein